MSKAFNYDTLVESVNGFKWGAVKTPDGLPEFSFAEKLSFAAPAQGEELNKALIGYRDYLEALEMKALIEASKISADCTLSIYLPEEEKLTNRAFNYVRRCLIGSDVLKEHMYPVLPANGYGDKLVVVEIVGKMLPEKDGFAVTLTTRLLAAERNAKDNQFYVTAVLE